MSGATSAQGDAEGRFGVKLPTELCRLPDRPESADPPKVRAHVPTVCPHCRFDQRTPTQLSVHLRFQCIALGRVQ
jgi:hypothetical protein